MPCPHVASCDRFREASCRCQEKGTDSTLLLLAQAFGVVSPACGVQIPAEGTVLFQACALAGADRLACRARCPAEATTAGSATAQHQTSLPQPSHGIPEGEQRSLAKHSGRSLSRRCCRCLTSSGDHWLAPRQQHSSTCTLDLRDHCSGHW